MCKNEEPEGIRTYVRTDTENFKYSPYSADDGILNIRKELTGPCFWPPQYCNWTRGS
jgi:hypothetical protein